MVEPVHLLRRLRHRLALRAIKRAPRPSLDLPADRQPLAILIPAIAKDLEILPLVVAGARRNLHHDLRVICIVAPPDNGIVAFCREHGCRFVNEQEVLPLTPRDIALSPSGVDRSGWLFQQLLKLSADTICSDENILLLDADTVFTRPQAMMRGDAPILRVSNELHQPYFDCIGKLMGFTVRPGFSFVAHHMVVSRKVLAQLRAHIERVNGRSWHEAIVNAIDPREVSGFSEYETYGHFLSFLRQPHQVEYWDNIPLLRSQMASPDEIERAWGSAKSVSFHDYHNA